MELQSEEQGGDDGVVERFKDVMCAILGRQ